MRTVTSLARIASVVAGIALAAMPAFAGAQGRAPSSMDVTGGQTVQVDVQRAIAYWQLERPDLATHCAERVVVQQPVAGVGNDGRKIPALDVWAETRLDGCTIVLSPYAWHEVTSAPRVGGRYGICTIVWHGLHGTCSTAGYSQWDVCDRIAHEYAHTLGLGDTTHGPRLLNQKVLGGDPICDLAFYPDHLSQSSQSWLVQNGLITSLRG